MQTQTLPSVEGITPDILWYTIIGLVGIGALIVLVDKVAEVFRKRKQRRELETQPSEELADKVAQTVIERLEPRFADIERKLASDKEQLDSHTLALSNHQEQIDAISDGHRVLCRGILALLSHEINGNSDDKLRASQQEITNYLIDK